MPTTQLLHYSQTYRHTTRKLVVCGLWNSSLEDLDPSCAVSLHFSISFLTMYCHVTRGQPRFFCILEPSVATCLAILSSLILWTFLDSALTFPDQFAPVCYHSVRHLSTIYLGSFSAICAVQLPDDESKSKSIRLRLRFWLWSNARFHAFTGTLKL